MAEDLLTAFLGQKLTSFLNAKMPDQRIILVTANQLYSNGFRYKR